MSTEQNQPEGAQAPPAEMPAQVDGQAPASQAAGEGRSRSFRRRRRRKNRGGGGPVAGMQANGQPQQGQPNGAPMPQGGQPQGQGFSQNNSQQQGQGYSQGQNNGGGGGFRRKKRKGFYDRGNGGGGGQQMPPIGNRADRPQFGGFGGGNGGGFGGRRKNRRKDRSFVGPMDHSYRAGNGNYSDSPAATIDVQGNRGSNQNNNRAHLHDTGHQAQFLGTVYEPPPPPIAEDATTRIFCFIEDLFFLAKIQESARKIGVKVEFVKADDVARVAGLPEGEKPALIVFDLNNANAKPLTTIPKLRAKLKRGTSIIGFLSHLQGDLKAKAVEAGCDSVMPRSAFSQNLPTMLRRYGIVEPETDLNDMQPSHL